jgi:hypothetical protein
MGNGKTEIGGGRPGMTTIAPTTDGKWLLTYEYWGGGTNVRYRISDDPTKFFSATDAAITALPVPSGGAALSTGGSPVLLPMPDGRIVYNASGSGDVWVNESGLSTGTWKEYKTPIAAGYSRMLQYVDGTGRVLILQASWSGGSVGPVKYAEVDLGRSDGAYYSLVNRLTGQVLSHRVRQDPGREPHREHPRPRPERRQLHGRHPALASDRQGQQRDAAQQGRGPLGRHLDRHRDGRAEAGPVGRRRSHRQTVDPGRPRPAATTSSARSSTPACT